MTYENITARQVLCFGDSNTYGYDPCVTAVMAPMSATRWCCNPCWVRLGRCGGRPARPHRRV